MADSQPDMDGWYQNTIHRLVQLCRFLSSKHTRMKVADTDEGKALQTEVSELLMLLDAYRSGAVAENS